MVRLREMRGWTQYDLAAASGLSVDTVRGYEQRKAWPRAAQFESLAHALESSPAALIAGPGEHAQTTAEDALSLLRSALANPHIFDALCDDIEALRRKK